MYSIKRSDSYSGAWEVCKNGERLGWYLGFCAFGVTVEGDVMKAEHVSFRMSMKSAMKDRLKLIQDTCGNWHNIFGVFGYKFHGGFCVEFTYSDVFKVTSDIEDRESKMLRFDILCRKYDPTWEMCDVPRYCEVQRFLEVEIDEICKELVCSYIGERSSLWRPKA